MDGRAEQDRIVRAAQGAAFAGGVMGLGSLVMVLGGELSAGSAFMGSGVAVVAGWASFLAACLLVLGLVGVAVRHAGHLSAVGSAALAVLVLATATTVGATSTLALVVPTLVERAPEIADNPPAAIPATFILSGLVMGVSAIVLVVALRRSGSGVPQRVAVLSVAAAVVAMAPLPSRFFLLSFAVAVLASNRDLAPTPRHDRALVS